MDCAHGQPPARPRPDGGEGARGGGRWYTGDVCDGTFEPEGVHIRKGQMYLGFVGDYPTAGSRKHTCIIKLK